MAIILPAQNLVLRAYSALVKQAPGYNAYNEHLAFVNANGEVAYKTALNSAFSSFTTAQLATNMLANLGLSSVFTQAQGEAYLNANASNRVSAIIDLAASLSNYTGTDAAILTAKSNYLATIDYSYTYSVEKTNTGSVELTTQLVNTVDLTANTDVKTANIFNAGLVYTPGGDNRINSLQDEDTLTGSGTNSTLNATLGNSNDNGATIITPKLNGISIINAAFTGSGDGAVKALDLQDATGQTAVNITRVSQAVNVAEVGNLMTAAASLSLANTNANQAGTVEFSYGQNVLKGDNTGTLSISNVQIGTLNIGENTSGIAARGVGVNGFEQLTLTSTGAAANTVGTLNLPMDTGTAGKLTITGSANLTLGAQTNVVNATNNALVEAAGVWTAGTGIAQAGGRISTIDASAFTGNLTLVLDNILDVGKAETSGVNQDVTVTGGSGNDTFVLYDAVQAGDTINGGAGTDTLLFYSGSSLASVAQNIENATMLADGSTGNISLDFDFLPNATGMTVRNISAVYPVGGTATNNAEAATTFTLLDMTAAQAAAITIQHATTGNGQVGNNVIVAAVKANTASDTVGVTIAEGTNVDPRFNFTLTTTTANTATAPTAGSSTIENITITDSDSESNSVLLTNFDKHTGTITLTGGRAGTYINLDLDTAGADVTANASGTGVAPGALAAGVQQGLLGLNTDGLAVDLLTGSAIDVGALATEVRLQAATIDASAEASNVIVRVSTNVASATGAQVIKMGSGNDTVIFDNLNDTRAGLTISDTVSGGAGSDTLVIDGNGVNVNLGASEWTNVSGFETIRLAGLGAFAYNLTLTNDLIDTNGGDMIAIINDNDAFNDTASNADTVTVASHAVSAATIDARTLVASNSFSYNGEEGAGRTADRFIFADANINGKAIIDGGAVDNVVATNSVANADVLEIRNAAVATVGDLANIKNVGTIAFNNDQAVAQTLTLQLNDTVVDSLVDSYHVSSTVAGNIETINVTTLDANVTEVAGAGLFLDVVGLTGKSAVNVTLNNTVAGAATDTLALSASGGLVTVANFETTADGAGVVGTAKDTIQLSKTAFAAITSAVGTNFSVAGEFLSNATGVAAAAGNRIIFNTATGDVWYDADGNGAGAAVQIAKLTGIADLAGADFTIVA
ncbi:MAG: hypothetical protein D3M94_15895 [Rhodocyclales bacterium GT-UBC]|nr:MAG: hypothetical protein D3M94_15895 [Rhodocyclales bacterium GT-UBC]